MIRAYKKEDYSKIAIIHDAARKIELHLAGLDDAFLPFSICSEREAFFTYPGIFVYEENQEILGFLACNEEELAWLYVDPKYHRHGIGKALCLYAFDKFPTIVSIEALVGNLPAKALYESLGFKCTNVVHGLMPGNERFPVQVYVFEKSLSHKE